MKNQIRFFSTAIIILILSCNKSSTTNKYSCNEIKTNTTITAGTYIVDCILTISNNAILTINPGVTLKFTSNGGMLTTGGGAIHAEGTTDAPIVFTGFEETKGYWKNIDIYSNSTNTIFSNCQFKYGGQGTTSMVRVGDGSSSNIGRAGFQHCSFMYGLKNGLYLAGNSFLNAFGFNTVSGNEQYPIATELRMLNSIPDLSNNLTGNGKDFIYVSDDYQIYFDVNFHPQTVPFYLNATSNNKFDINSKWTVDPGVKIVMGSNLMICFIESDGTHPAGTFDCQGSISNRISIKGFESTKGYWNKIRFMGTSNNNIIKYTDISDGGSNTDFPYIEDPGIIGLFSDGVFPSNQLTISNCSISNSLHYGIDVKMGQGAVVNNQNTISSITSNLRNNSSLTFSNYTDGDVHVH